MKRISFVIFIHCLIMLGCNKEEGTTTFVDGNNIAVAGNTTYLNYSYIENYNSGNSSELVSSLHYSNAYPIPPPSWDNAKAVYSIFIPNLKKGDVIYSSGKSEITGSFSGYNIWIFGTIIIAQNQNDIPTSNNIIEISEKNGYNYTPDMGHYVSTHSASYECRQDLGDRRINFIIGAITCSQISTGGNLTVEQDFGRLIVIVFRKQHW